MEFEWLAFHTAADFQPMESDNKIDIFNREQWIEEDLENNGQIPETQSELNSKPRYRKVLCFVLGPR